MSDKIKKTRKCCFITLGVVFLFSLVLILIYLHLVSPGWLINTFKLSIHSDLAEIKLAVLAPAVYACLCVQLLSSIPGSFHETFDLWYSARDICNKPICAKVGLWFRLVFTIIQLTAAFDLLVLAILAAYLIRRPFALLLVLSGAV